MTEKEISEEEEANGRTVQINTGFYEVQVWGDPEDGLEDVLNAAHDAADRAKRDVVELEEADDADGIQFG